MPPASLRMEDTALATRWSPPEKDLPHNNSNILWAAVCRDDVLLSEILAQPAFAPLDTSTTVVRM